MYYESGISKFYEEILKGRISFSIVSLLMLAGITALFLYVTVVYQFGLYVLILVVSVLVIYLMVNYPKIWLYLVAGLSFTFFRESSEGISAVDYATAVLYSASLVIWLLWMTLVNRKRVVESIGDWLMVFFFLAHILNFVVALTYGNDMLGWLRETLRTVNILYFIPIRYYFNDRKDLSKLLAIFGISIFIAAVLQFYDYYQTLHMDAVYLYELATSVRINQAIFSASTIFGFIFLIHSKNVRNQIVLLIFTGTAFAGLFTSFSRSFWLTIAFNVLIIFIFASKSQKIKISVYMACIITVLTIVLFSIFGDYSKYLVQIVESRIVSSVEGKKDVSVRMRIAEYNAVYKKIMENPLSGNGLGSKIRFYHSAYKKTMVTHNIHNGYLYTAQRYGIPMALLFLCSVLYYLFKSFYYIRKLDNGFDKMLALGAFNTLLMLIIASFAAAIFFYRDGLLTLAFSIAVISIVDKNRKEKVFKELNE